MKRIAVLVAALTLLAAGAALAATGSTESCTCQATRGSAPAGLTAIELAR